MHYEMSMLRGMCKKKPSEIEIELEMKILGGRFKLLILRTKWGRNGYIGWVMCGD